MAVAVSGITRPPGAAVTPRTGAGSSKLITTALVLYIYLIFSRVLDISPISWMHIPMILILGLSLAAFSRGGFGEVFSVPITRMFGLFTLWVVVCFPFAYWRAVAMDTMRQTVQAFLVFLCVVQLVRTREVWRRVTGAYAFATVTAAICSFFFGRDVQGRLAMAGGTLADPNEFALFLLIGLPLLWLKASQMTGFKRAATLLCAIPILMSVAGTGSRAGMIALAAIVVVTFLFSNAPRKLLVIGLVIAGLLAGAVFLPGYLKVRFVTLFGGDVAVDADTAERLKGDIGSSEGRKSLLIQSVKMSFEHPIFGVGPGCFPFVAWDERKAAGIAPGTGLMTHNTYTQISSEIGLPGFLFFFVSFACSVRWGYRAYTAGKQSGDVNAANDGRYFFTSAAGMAIGIFFLCCGYTDMMAVFIALAASLQRTLAQESDLHNSTDGQPARALLPTPTFTRKLQPRRTPRKTTSPLRLVSFARDPTSLGDPTPQKRAPIRS